MVSVLMSVFNGGKYLNESISSILNQTYSNFELIIINDGSIDDTEKIILTFQDSRIRYFKNDENKGLIFSLNRGLLESKGKYIARMDADDISCPNRLEIQTQFLDNNPEYILCGTFVEVLPGGLIKTPPVINYKIRFALLFGNVYYHSSIMFRASVFLDYNLYYEEEFLNCEDYRFWTRISKFGKLSTLESIGIKYRIHSGQITNSNPENLYKSLDKIRVDYLESMNIFLPKKYLNTFQKFCNKEHIEYREIESLISSFYFLLNFYSNKNRSFVKLELLNRYYSFLIIRSQNKEYVFKDLFNFLVKFKIFSFQKTLNLLSKDFSFFFNR